MANLDWIGLMPHAVADNLLHWSRGIGSSIITHLSHFRDRLKWTPLAHACYNGHVEVAHYLLQVSRADVRLVDDWNTTVLHCLAKQRDVDIFDDATTAAELVVQVW